MPFTIPNNADAAFAAQSQVDKVDLDILVAATKGNGVVSGCAVTTTGTGNGSVSVASGVMRFDDRRYTVSSGTLAIGANSSGNPRFDLIRVSSSGTPGVTAGTASANPVFPAVPAGSVALAVVYVPDGHTTSTTIPANTIVDKRADVPGNPAGDTDAGAHYQITAPNDDLALLRIKGAAAGGAPTNLQLTEWIDYLGAPIAWMNSTGGFGINDWLRTAYTVFGPYPWVADIYGFAWQGTRCGFSFAGPPGNMLSWPNACHEVFQSSRLASVGDWSAVAACTIATTDFGAPPATPTGYRSGIRITNTSGSTAWIAMPGGAFAVSGVTAGQVVSGVAWLKSATASAARNANVRLSFYNDAGTQQGSDFNSSSISIPNTGVWTRVPLDGVVAPTGSTKVQIHILVASANTETHDVCGVGVMKNQQFGVFGPPFVAQDTLGGPKTSEGIALAGDKWIRTDVPKQPGRREYTCHTGGAPNLQVWGPIDAASLYVLEADVSSTSTTQADVAAFAVPVDANGFYQLDYSLFITTAATTTGWTIGFTGPASPTYFFGVVEYQSSATAWTTATIQSFTNFTAVTTAYTAAPNIIHLRIKAQLANGANAGTVNLRWATEVSSSAAIIKRGSVLSVT